MILSQAVRRAAVANQVRTYASAKLFAELTTPNGITYKQPTGLYIGGEFVPSLKGKTFEVTSPATEEKIVDLQQASEEDVDVAVDKAQLAYEKWASITPYERGRALHKIADKIEENADLFAAVETWDNGKALSMAKGDVADTVMTFRYYAGWADKIHGKVVDTDNDHFNYIRREPLGVTAAVIPWNFPLLMLSWKFAPALAAGNSMLLKSAESTPLSALLFASVVDQVAEVPKGTITILNGFGDVGGALSAHPKIKKIAFTGSTRTGRKILESAAKTNLKKVTLELGGKSPNIVFDDAKIDEAIEAALFGIFFNQGEVCCAGTRLFVQEGIYEEFLARLVERAKELKVGDPFDPNTTYGAQTNKQQYDIVMDYIAKGRKEARLLTGGNAHPGKGYFVEPTIFADADRNASIAREEIFGPVLSVVKFTDSKQALEFANDSQYGLASGIHTTCIEKALYVASNLQAGTVWINTYNALHHQLPFGGYKTSGTGRELGEEVLANYMETKTVRIAGIASGLGAPKLN